MQSFEKWLFPNSSEVVCDIASWKSNLKYNICVDFTAWYIMTLSLQLDSFNEDSEMRRDWVNCESVLLYLANSKSSMIIPFQKLWEYRTKRLNTVRERIGLMRLTKQSLTFPWQLSTCLKPSRHCWKTFWSFGLNRITFYKFERIEVGHFFVTSVGCSV